MWCTEYIVFSCLLSFSIGFRKRHHPSCFTTGKDLFYCGPRNNVSSQNDADIPKLRFYFRSIENFSELPLEKANDIFITSWFNSSRPTVIFSHGFTGRPTGPAVMAVITTYLEQDEYNVALLDWRHFAAHLQGSMASSYLNWAAPNARKLGVQFSNILLNMSKVGLDLHRTYLVGHSLGAHIFGITGNILVKQGILIPWIIGLDPAGVTFDGKPLPTRLHAGSASFVTVIHSDPTKYGYRKPLGTVDFWPNFKITGSLFQPGCEYKGSVKMFSPEDLCNHNRSWQYLIEAIKEPGTIIGSYAKNYRKWKEYTDEQRRSTVLDIGKLNQNVTKGDYFFTTNSAAPFGKGELGLKLN